ncbi:MAG: hypothetical protein QOH63_2880 [Acidobacteriota bacterium]|jgi:hypothetical protein|nr:hypothetical protein [Acidobacteriota bacterium]
MMRRVLTIIFAVSWIVPAGLFSLALPERCVGQSASAPDFDYESLAIDLILSVADEAAKLPDIEQKVTLLISAAKILPASRRDDAIRLLDIALSKLKAWEASEKARWGRRYKAATLRTEVLSAYAKFDSKKALALQKESASKADSSTSESDGTSRPLKDQDGSADILERQQRAGEVAKIALSIMDTDFERALTLIVQSVRGGTVTGEIFNILQKLKQSGDRVRLNKLETRIGETLAQAVTFDSLNLDFATGLIPSDRDMPPAARNGIILFFMNSLRAWVNLVKDESARSGLDPSEVGSTFISFFRLRPVIAQYLLPEELSTYDLLLDQVSPLIPAKAKARLQMTAPETISNPRDRLADIIKESNTRRREVRLMRLVFDSTRDSAPDELLNGLELASDAVSHISDERLKATLNDFVVITHVNLLVKEKKFADAQHLAESIPTTEARVWTQLALSSVIHKEDGARALDLIRDALKTLDGASSSARKVELALLAVAMLAKDDPLRALEMLSVAARYANSKLSKVEIPNEDIVHAINVDVSIGNMSTILSRAPESLTEIEIAPSLSLLGEAKYWFQSQQIADDFHETELRLLLKLKFAGSILAHNLKQKKDAAQKPVLK